MAIVGTRKTRAGDLIKFEGNLDHGYERESRSLTVALDAEIGGVYKTDGTLLAAVDVEAAGEILAENLAILVDDEIYFDGLGAGTRSYACLVGGPGASGSAIVVREQLRFADAMSVANVDEVVARLNVLGIKVASQV